MIKSLNQKLKTVKRIPENVRGSFTKLEWLAIVLFCAVCIMGLPTTGRALSDTPNQNTWVTDGEVYAVVSDGTTTYIGGSFTYVGPHTGTGVPIDVVTGSSVAIYPEVDGSIGAVVPDGMGGWYVGGTFSKVGGVVRNCLAHILSDGTVDSLWNPNASGDSPCVSALAVSNGIVYVGGSFTEIGGQARSNIAALDASTGSATSWNPNPSAGADFLSVYALAVSNGTVYVAGYFTSIGGQARNNIAALDASTGNATSWNPNADGFVGALALSNGTVYAGGSFTKIGGQARNNIVALDATTGNATSWNPNADAATGFVSVNTLVAGDGIVYVGGNFTSMGGQSRNNIAAVDATTGNATSWNPNTSGSVIALALSNGTVYAGGSFTSIGGQARGNIAALDASTGSVTSWNPNAGGSVNALAVSNGTVYAGGNFGSIGGLSRNNIAALDVSTGRATSWNPNVSAGKEYSVVFALAVSGGTVYAGGQFTMIGGQARNNIAALDASKGSATSWNPNADGSVSALAISGGTVYAGGSFSSIGGQTRSGIAALDVSTGSATSWNPNANGLVKALAVSGGVVFVGGSFSNIGGQDRNNIAALDVSTGNATSWNPNAADGFGYTSVYTLAVSGGVVYVGGSFSSIGGQDRNNLAALDASTGNATSWNPNVSAGDPMTGMTSVNALAVSDETIYAGGAFSVISGQNRKNVAALDASTGNATSWNPNAEYYVDALAASNEAVYAGGAFTRIGGDYWPFIARFDSDIPSSHSISGKVSLATAPLSGVTIALSGAATSIATTGANGTYAFSGLNKGVYTITPSKAQYTFSPAQITTNLNGSDITGQDFSGTLQPGSLIVTLGPQAAVSAGAQWKVDQGSWQATGSTVSNIAPGQHMVTFKDVSGWTTPTAQNVGIESGKTARVAGTYVQQVAVDFTATPKIGKAPLTVKFSDKSIGTIKSWLWDFGDGKTGTSQNPSYTYPKPGTYTVKLTVTRADGTKNTRTQTNLISVYAAPKADFTATPTKGKAPLAVKFTDKSTGGASSWSWNFGDGQTSKDQNPSHTYTKAGKYTVTLTIANPVGTNTKTKANFIVVSEAAPVADFSADRVSGEAPLKVTFSDKSIGNVTKWSWKFGDGGTSSTKNPIYTYKKAGSYTVTLTAIGAGGSNTMTKTKYITATQ